MPRQSKTAQEETLASPLPDVVEQTIVPTLSVSPTPVFICGVNRKINIGNFENIDVYAGVSLPLANVSAENREALQEAIENAAAYAFELMSKETGQRYLLIKESQQGA
jgi:hypothetical protein